MEACSAALQIDSSDTRALYRRSASFSSLPTRVYGSCTLRFRGAVRGWFGAGVWRSGLAHNRLKKFDRAKTDLKRACVP